MNPTWKWISYLLPLFAVAVLVTGCSDDDDGTDPGPAGNVISMDLRAGDDFIYDKWTLDENNNKVGQPTTVEVEYKNSTGSTGGFSDYVKVEETDVATNTETNYLIRTDNNGNLYRYAFVYDQLDLFISLLRDNVDPTINPSLGSRQWDLIAKFQDDAGNALSSGATFNVAGTTIEDIKFGVNVQGFDIPVTVRPEITGYYEGSSETMEVQGTTVNMWKCRIQLTMKIFSSIYTGDVVTNLIVWYSDNPDGRIKMIFESTTVSIPGFDDYTQFGEQFELKAFVN